MSWAIDQSWEEDEVSEMTLSDALGVLIEAGRTDLVANWDSIQEFLLEKVCREYIQGVGA